MGRPPIGDKALSSTERSRRRRERLKLHATKLATKLATEPTATKRATEPEAAAFRREIEGLEGRVDRLQKVLAEKAVRIQQLERSQLGLVSRAEFNKIMKCLHSDTLQGHLKPGTPDDFKKQYDEAFRIFRTFEVFLKTAEQDAEEVRKKASGEDFARAMRDAMAWRRDRLAATEKAAQAKREAAAAKRAAAKAGG